MELAKKKCVPCEGGVPKLTRAMAENYLQEIPGWELVDEKLFKRFRCKGFLKAIEFVNKMATIAETENHHPNFTVNYQEVEVTIWTHAIGGLSENDFILAAKIEEACKTL